jgi:hypothetical protein
MKNHVLNLIGGTVLSLFISYLITSFLLWDLRLWEWDFGGRALLIVIAVVVFVVTGLVLTKLEEGEETEEK